MAILYRHRNVPASAASCVVVAFAIWMQTHRPSPIRRENPSEPITLTLVEPPPPAAPTPPPPAPTPPPPSPQPPRPTPTPPVPAPPKPVDAKPTPAPSQNPVPVPRTEQPPPAPAAAQAPPPPPAPPPAPPAPPAPPPTPPADPNAAYTARVRAYLNGTKRYPKGREVDIQRPEGKVRVWFILKRDGSVVDQGVEDSSNSIYLDNAAVSTVKRGTMPAFGEAFGSEETHRFTVDLDFKPG